jgi:conjugal transfer pilus assembly protein TraF
VLLCAAAAQAQMPARGWFWYQEPPPPPASAPIKPKPKQPVPKPAASKPAPVASAPKPAASAPPPLSVEWIRKQLPLYQDRAIDDPTPEHVAQYLALQKIMFDKAQNFAQASVKAREMYPGLSQGTFTPFDPNSLLNMKNYEQQVRPFALKQIAAHAGLIFFFDSTCQFCVNQWRQIQVLKVLAPGIQILAVSADGKPLPGVEMKGWVPNNGITRTFGIKIYPTVALVWSPNHVALVGQGAVDAATLSSNVLNAAVDHDLLPKSYARWIHPFEQGVLSPLDISGLAAHNSEKPDALLQGVSSQSLKQYQQLDQPQSPQQP